MLTVNETEEGVTFTIRVLPRSSKCELAGLQEDALRLRIKAPPVEGRANEESIRFLAALFNVKRNQVAIKAGHKSKNKLISITGLTRGDILAALPESCRAMTSGLLF
jgi:uncharacterized protein (TIGR00251 family)